MNGTGRSPLATARQHWPVWAALHGAVALFGLAGLFGKWVLADPLWIVFGRVAVASIAFWLWFRLSHSAGAGPLRELPPRLRLALLLCGGLLAFHWFAFFQSIRLSTVAIGLIAYSTAPVFVVLAEPVLFAERFVWRTAAAALLTLAGIGVMLPPEAWLGAVESAAAGAASAAGTAGAAGVLATAGTALGIAWGVASGASFALLALLNRRWVRSVHAIRIAYYEDLGALLWLAPVVLWLSLSGEGQPPSGRDLLLLLVLGLVCTALAHTLFIRALTVLQAGVATVTSALEPVYGSVLALWWLGEVPALRTLAGGALILLAVLWASLPRAHVPAL